MRPKRLSTPVLDMTPFTDLAFLLFFSVLMIDTLSKPKGLPITAPSMPEYYNGSGCFFGTCQRVFNILVDSSDNLYVYNLSAEDIETGTITCDSMAYDAIELRDLVKAHEASRESIWLVKCHESAKLGHILNVLDDLKAVGAYSNFQSLDSTDSLVFNAISNHQACN